MSKSSLERGKEGVEDFSKSSKNVISSSTSGGEGFELEFEDGGGSEKGKTSDCVLVEIPPPL